MTPEGLAKVEEVANLVNYHLREISQYFVEGMQLTFVARMPGSDKGHMLITTHDEDLSAVIEVISREIRKEMQ